MKSADLLYYSENNHWAVLPKCERQGTVLLGGRCSQLMNTCTRIWDAMLYGDSKELVQDHKSKTSSLAWRIQDTVCTMGTI